MTTILSGRIQSVWDDVAGSDLADAAAIGDDTLHPSDTSWAAEEGGSIVVGDELLVYTAVDFETNILTLDDAVSEYHGEGEVIQPTPTLQRRYAEVWLDGEDHEDDPEPAVVRVPNVMRVFVPVGTRDDLGELCTVIDHGDGWEIKDLTGEEVTFGSEYAPVERFFKYTAHGLETDHMSISLRAFLNKGYTGTAYWARAVTNGDAPTSDAEFNVRLNGSLVCTCTIKAGHRRGRRVDFDATPFVDTDRWKVKHVDIADLEPDVFVYIFVELDAEKDRR